MDVECSALVNGKEFGVWFDLFFFLIKIDSVLVLKCGGKKTHTNFKIFLYALFASQCVTAHMFYSTQWGKKKRLLIATVLFLVFPEIYFTY